MGLGEVHGNAAGDAAPSAVVSQLPRLAAAGFAQVERCRGAGRLHGDAAENIGQVGGGQGQWRRSGLERGQYLLWRDIAGASADGGLAVDLQVEVAVAQHAQPAVEVGAGAGRDGVDLALGGDDQQVAQGCALFAERHERLADGLAVVVVACALLHLVGDDKPAGVGGGGFAQAAIHEVAIAGGHARHVGGEGGGP